MKIRYKLFVTSLLIALVGLSSCTEEQGKRLFSNLVQAPPSSIERDVRGHEMIASVQANLYYARMSNKRLQHWGRQVNLFYGYTVAKTETPLPMQQTIELAKNAQGALVITSPRKAFDVLKGQNIYYILELKYYDVNGKLINHQFSTYDAKDADYSTLEQHQTMFSIHTHSLNKQQLTYPMTLDSIYYDKYLFDLDASNQRVKATLTSSIAVYAPEELGDNSLKYNPKMAEVAIDNTSSIKATEPLQDKSTGKTTYLYKTLTGTQLNKLSKEIFSYEYRDTDPVDSYLEKPLLYDDQNRNRIGKKTGFLRQKRALEPNAVIDYLGFKGLMNFKQANMAFQLRVAICHIIDAGAGCTPPNCGKYRASTVMPWRSFNAQDIPPYWNTYDLDYPLPFRVIADIDGDKDKFIKDVQKYYPKAVETEIKKMFASHLGGDKETEKDYFRGVPFYRF